jgi:hypothetical protein
MTGIEPGVRNSMRVRHNAPVFFFLRGSSSRLHAASLLAGWEKNRKFGFEVKVAFLNFFEKCRSGWPLTYALQWGMAVQERRSYFKNVVTDWGQSLT